MLCCCRIHINAGRKRGPHTTAHNTGRLPPVSCKQLIVSRDFGIRATPTPTPSYSTGAQGRHCLAPGLVDGPGSMTQKDRDRVVVACMIGAAPMVSPVTCYGSSNNLHANVSVGTPTRIGLFDPATTASLQSNPRARRGLGQLEKIKSKEQINYPRPK